MLFGSNFFYQLERKYSRYAVRNLMSYLIFAQAAVFLSSMMIHSIPIYYYLYFDLSLILKGQIWRLFTFVLFPPPFSHLILVVFAFYLYWMIGQSLERTWGSFKFNMFYLCGVLGTIAAGFITYVLKDPTFDPFAGSVTNFYLNLSLFFSFAILFPNTEFLIFFIIPVKVKYLGYLNAVLFIISFISENFAGRLSMLAAIFNIILFFGGDLWRTIAQIQRRRKWMKDAENWFKRGQFFRRKTDPS